MFKSAIFVACVLLFTGTASAKDSARPKTAAAEPVHVSSESSYSSSASDTKMAFGVMDASNISVGESLSG